VPARRPVLLPGAGSQGIHVGQLVGASEHAFKWMILAEIPQRGCQPRIFSVSPERVRIGAGAGRPEGRRCERGQGWSLASALSGPRQEAPCARRVLQL
jgi:hypothetical protein